MTGEDQRQRLDGAAFCVAHRLRYDPQLNVGCVLCQRALSLPAAEPARRPRPGLGLGGAVAAGALIGLGAAFALELGPLLWAEPQGGAPRALSGSLHGLGVSTRSDGPATVAALRWQPSRDAREQELPEGAPRTGLHGAAARGDVAAIAQELAAHAAIDELDSQALTPLLWALRAGRPEAARALIERGARVDLGTPASPPPLVLAAAAGLESITALLLARGAKASAADETGAGALMLAARHDHLGVVRSLLEHGAEVGRSDGMGRSALMHAALGGASSELIALLLARGAALEARDVDGASALLLAAEQGHEPSARTLLDRGAELGARDQRGWSALDRAVQPRPGASQALIDRLYATFELLVERGIDARLTLDAATTRVLFRDELERLYTRRGLGRLPAYEPPGVRDASGRSARTSLRPATVQLLAPIHDSYQAGELADGTLIGYRGWTFVPRRLVHCVVRNVALYGDQRATLAGDAAGAGKLHVADVMLFEQRENGRVIERAFAGRPDGIEVEGAPVRRLGARSREFAPGAFDLTPFLSHDGRELVISVLSGYGAGRVSSVYLRIDGADAQRVIARAEVERSGGVP